MTLYRPRVVVIGAGFGGLYAAQTLVNEPVDVLLIDRHNYHTFTPLLYQVATSGLDPSEIAYPVRQIFFDKPNVSFMMGEVIAINLGEQSVTVRVNGTSQREPYDYLIVAAGSVTNYFGKAEWAQSTFGLKTLAEAVHLRNHILRLFERAAWVDDPEYREALTTMVVVGGGPTGLETAGALHELYNHVLRREYRQSEAIKAKVILVEATDRLLIPFPEPLQQSALKQLRSLGVEVVLGNPVAEVAPDHVTLKDGRVIPTYTLVWGAGVKASPMGSMLGLPLQRGGRVPVEPTLEAVGCDQVYIVGDMAYLEDKNGQPYPQLIPVAKQQGKLAARNILRHARGKTQEPFRYRDRGIMATIGRNRAVAWIYNRISLTGWLAWVAWLFLHLIWLLGFRNRMNVLVNWVWNYVTFDRSVRLILEPKPLQQPIIEEEPENLPVA